ncbi:MAG TPA: hypothetical protein VJC18_03250, partial [bacterium]|nr:hypothetical protein [bacterium]
RVSTFTDPLDEDTDDVAESVTETVDLDATLVRTIDAAEEHNVDVTTMDDSFAALDEDGEAITVTVTKPEALITFDNDTHRMASRTVLAGNLVVDHNLANIRVVFGVGDAGLTHVAGFCDPYEGEMNFTAYTIEEDDTIGAVVGTGSITYANGTVQSSVFEGTTFEITTRPCD